MSDKSPLFRFLDSKKEESLEILEVGVAQCATGIQILERYPNFNYTGIDKWEYDITLKHEQNKIKNWNSQEKWDNIYKNVIDNTFKFGDRCTIIRNCSREILPVYDKKFDFIHIDGDHSEEGAYQDLILCKNLLKKNGIMWMDDVELSSIKLAVNKFLDENKNYKLKDKFKIYCTDE
jgi:hypothetical protein